MMICYVLMLVNLVNLTLTGASGYWHFDILGASHTRFALFMILIFTITETVVMYFFISTGKAIKSAIESGLGKDGLWSRERQLKMRLFPQLMLTILLVGGWFIHIGAIENQMSPVWVHHLIFALAYMHHFWSLMIKNDSFKEQLSIIAELEPEQEPA
ncbi:MAG: hypothetical protein QF780_10900 [Candidatus Marinimicrobia bacterium]|nr:hypothetical protein [Candidatus Neomarinimicrobiota bacterium]